MVLAARGCGALASRTWARCTPSLSAAACHQSTSTMDLVASNESRSIVSTLQFKPERDFSVAVPQRRVDEQWKDAFAVAALNDDREVRVAHELNLVEASQQRHMYDKILLLVHHGEEDSRSEQATDSLSGRGVGQALSLSRRTASFLTEETGLSPELFLLGPSRKVLQTMFLGFPYDTPYHSIKSARWICHPHLSSDGGKSSVQALQREFAGIDTTLCSAEIALESSEDQLQQASDVLDLLEERPEKVVVVSGDSSWLQSMGRTLGTQSTEQLEHGEMLVIGTRLL